MASSYDIGNRLNHLIFKINVANNTPLGGDFNFLTKVSHKLNIHWGHINASRFLHLIFKLYIILYLRIMIKVIIIHKLFSHLKSNI